MAYLDDRADERVGRHFRGIRYHPRVGMGRIIGVQVGLLDGSAVESFHVQAVCRCRLGEQALLHLVEIRTPLHLLFRVVPRSICKRIGAIKRDGLSPSLSLPVSLGLSTSSSIVEPRVASFFRNRYIFNYTSRE